MNTIAHIQDQVISLIEKLYSEKVSREQVTVQLTKKEFEGDYTIVLFPFVKMLKKSPPEIGEALGKGLMLENTSITGYQLVSGFLNLQLGNGFWRQLIADMEADEQFWMVRPTGTRLLIESSSPNTNKPLHLGHIRNILLGDACSRIFRALGFEVIRVQVINDRGIAICKSMLAWQKYANGSTPESTEIKGDHFVGNWYVMFEREFQAEYTVWQKTEEAQKAFQARKDPEQSEEAFFKEYKNRYFNLHSELGKEARDLLLKWEAGDKAVVALWKRMNGWVYDGFDKTYEALGVEYDKMYYESETYLLGKEYVRQGLKRRLFFQKEDGSVWVDLRQEGLDMKVLQRSDGTSVYITQDIGTAQERYDDFQAERMIYVVADEQNYHFEVLFATLQKLEVPYADGLFHLSYGMVDLPTGKMKSREGTVVDADDLIDDVLSEARNASQAREEFILLEKKEQEAIVQRLGLGALKYYILKVDPRKRMTFNPAESVDLQGQTGPYIQNAYVRIQSILRKTETNDQEAGHYTLLDEERKLLAILESFAEVVRSAGNAYSPALIANYLYDLAKDFHRYYHEVSVLNAETDAARSFRLRLIHRIAAILKDGMELLGIEMPERM